MLAQAKHVPWPARALVARAAARRGMGAAALAAAPFDPEVLMDLGLYASAAASGNATASIIGLAGLGRIADARRLFENGPPLADRGRTRLAQAAAPGDAAWAFDLLSDDAFEAKAACALQLGRLDQAEAMIERASPSRERLLVEAAIQAAQGRFAPARVAVNALFAGDGLEPPLGVEALPLSLPAFHAEAQPLAGERPIVSVIVAAKDAARTIETAIRSLQVQTWPALKILVIDDGSTDDTADRVRALGQADGRVQLYANRRAGGAYGARNTGLDVANGTYVAFHDADDWAHPRRIERQVEQLTQASGALCGYFRVADDGRIVNPRVFPLLRRNPILLMMRRDTALRMGPMDEVRLGADSEYLARLDDRLGRWSVKRMAECLVVAGWSSTSLMGSGATGLSVEGLARRVAYVEDWRRRHATWA